MTKIQNTANTKCFQEDGATILHIHHSLIAEIKIGVIAEQIFLQNHTHNFAEEAPVSL